LRASLPTAAFGRGTRRAPLSQSRNACRWIAATTRQARKRGYPRRCCAPRGSQGQARHRPGNTQQYEIQARWLRPRIASITKSPIKHGKLCSSCRQSTSSIQRHGRGRSAEQDCPRRGRPARMVRFHRNSTGSIAPVSVAQAGPSSVICEPAGRFSQRRMPGMVPGGGRM
jgi:hypothetical protein